MIEIDSDDKFCGECDRQEWDNGGPFCSLLDSGFIALNFIGDLTDAGDDKKHFDDCKAIRCKECLDAECKFVE